MLKGLLPTIILCVSGKPHLFYAIWCVTSLKQFGYQTIEIVVGSEREKRLFSEYFPEIPCNVVSIHMDGYPKFSYKPFALIEYLDKVGLHHKGRDIVICDADVLWKQDPVSLFERFKGCYWVHKLTAVDPNDYDIGPADVPLSNIGLRTILNYRRRKDIHVYPNFIANAGLFMLPESAFPVVLEKWFSKIASLPPNEMLMSEALLSLTFAEMGLTPTADLSDIKYYGRHEVEWTEFPVLSFIEAKPLVTGQFTGYQTATHYYGDQRAALHRDVVTLGLDTYGFVEEANKSLTKTQSSSHVRLLKRLMRYFVR